MLDSTFRRTASVFGLIGFVAFAPAPAFAQAETESIEDAPIVVTAQRRAEAQVDVPITVTTLGTEQLETASANDLTDIGKVTPGLRFDNAGGYFQPTIRGVGTAVTSAGGQGNVGIYVDGFYSPNPLATDFDLLNVRSIQVLKGPQGTLFGRNTTGGAILVSTMEPSTDTSGKAKVSFGRYSELDAQAYATFGISETVAIDVQGLYRRGEGWRTNISNGKEVGDYENWSVRLGMKADLSDTVSLLLRYQHGKVDDPSPLLTASYNGPDVGAGHPYYALPGQFTFKKNEVASGTNPSDQEFFRSNSDTVQMTVTADLDFADLTSYSQYRKEIVDASIELDYSGVEYFQLGLPNNNETWSQELLLTSKPGGKLQWTAGLFYFQNRDTYLVYTDYFPALGAFSRSNEFGSSSTVVSYAAFFDATYEVTPQLFLTAGVRYAKDEIKDAYSRALFGPRVDATKALYDEVNGDRITPRFVIRYKPTEETSIYASYTKGYKAAIFDHGRGTPLPVNPETLDAFEVGFKLDNRRLSFEASAFYYDYKNLQVSIYETGTAIIINAAQSEIYGADAQVRFEVSDAFSLNAGLAYVHGRYKRFEKAPVYSRICSPGNIPFQTPGCFFDTFTIAPNQTLRNVTMQRTPEFTGNVGAVYKAEVGGGELMLSGNLFYTSSFFFGPSGIQFKQKAYEVASLRAQWTDPSDTYTIALWGDNVTNSRYKSQVQYALSGIGTNWSKPVTYGVEFGVNF